MCGYAICGVRLNLRKLQQGTGPSASHRVISSLKFIHRHLIRKPADQHCQHKAHAQHCDGVTEGGDKAAGGFDQPACDGRAQKLAHGEEQGGKAEGDGDVAWGDLFGGAGLHHGEYAVH